MTVCCIGVKVLARSFRYGLGECPLCGRRRSGVDTIRAQLANSTYTQLCRSAKAAERCWRRQRLASQNTRFRAYTQDDFCVGGARQRQAGNDHARGAEKMPHLWVRMTYTGAIRNLW